MGYQTLKTGDVLQEGDEMSDLANCCKWSPIVGLKSTPKVGDASFDCCRKFRRPVKGPVFIEKPQVQEPEYLELKNGAGDFIPGPVLQELETLRKENAELKNKLRETEVAVSVYRQLQRLLGVENTVISEVQNLLFLKEF